LRRFPGSKFTLLCTRLCTSKPPRTTDTARVGRSEGADQTRRRRRLLRRPLRLPAKMGQKRETSLAVEFVEADKECLVRLVKELAKEGAAGDKVTPAARCLLIEFRCTDVPGNTCPTRGGGGDGVRLSPRLLIKTTTLTK